MIRNLLVLDTETTGLDPTKDHLLEVAVALWSVEHRALVDVTSRLLRAPSNAAEAVNGIPSRLLVDSQYAMLRDGYFSALGKIATRADAIVAHGAEFDRSWFPVEVFGVTPWICSMDDVEWPRPSTSRSLVAIALAHGVGVVHAHRAISDVLTLVRLLERVAETHDLAAMLKRAMRPKRVYQSLQRFDDNDLAKEHGFRWDPDAKIWWKKLVPEDVPGLALPFEIREVA